MAKIYLIPNTLGGDSVNAVIPSEVQTITKSIKHFVVENIRTTRRYLKAIDKSINIDELTFYELNKNTTAREVISYLKPLKEGNDIGIISEAGCPGVADPGADLVKIAHEQKYTIVPLVGPSSILMALMASGMNGQSFAFNGYIPIKKGERTKKIKQLEARSFNEKHTQLLIEAPYRNTALLKDILEACSPQTRICIACNITAENEYIKTQTAAQWKKNFPEHIQKLPTLFLIHKD